MTITHAHLMYARLRDVRRLARFLGVEVKNGRTRRQLVDDVTGALWRSRRLSKLGLP